MVRIFIGLGVVALGLLIYCAVECIQTPKHRVRVLSKTAWLAIILLLPLIGGGLWMAFGRARRQPQAPQRSGPRAPDDDPDFLRKVEIQRRQRQRAEENRRKEQEQRKKQQEQAKNEDGGQRAEGTGNSAPEEQSSEPEKKNPEETESDPQDESDAGSGPDQQRS